MKLIERFWNKVVLIDECYEWQGSTNNHGYGKLKVNGKDEFAHRVSFELLRGNIGDKCVLHTCDNPLCVNPQHLYLGDQKQNAKDRKDRNRHGTKKSLEDITKMKELRNKGWSYTAIADLLGCSSSTVWSLCRNGN